MLAVVAAWCFTHRAILIAGGAALACPLVLAYMVRLVRRRMPIPRDRKSRATIGYYLAGLLGTALSADTSFRFFGDKLHITGAERIGMFALIEVGLIACAYGMRANVRHADPATGKPGSPGTARVIAWVLCGFAGYAALVEAGPVEGVARIILGPVFAMVMLHQALGIEIRNSGHHKTGTWQRVISELREGLLSYVGLSDSERDAVTRRRDRAARRVVRLSITAGRKGWMQPVRLIRLERAVLAADLGNDSERQTRVVAAISAARSARQLPTLQVNSPWRDALAANATATRRAATATRTATPAANASATATANSANSARAVAPTQSANTATPDRGGEIQIVALPATGPAEKVAPVADLAQRRRITASPLPAGSGNKTAVMRQVFDEYAQAGRLNELTGAELARRAGAHSSLGRKYLGQWTAEASSRVVEGGHQ